MASTPWHLLTSSASIQPRDWPQSASGIVYGDAGDNVPVIVRCMLQPISAGDALVYGRDTTTQVFDVYLAPTTTMDVAWDCSPKDTITIDSVVYRIVGKPKNLCNLGAVKHLVVEVDTN